MKKNNMISIIVPVHNAEKSIEKCVNSLLNQKEQEIEIILIENGSTDHSFKMCREFAQQHNNIICIKNDKTGVSAARNKGLSIATGDIVGFCDADDYYEDGSLKIVKEAFEKENKLDILVTGFNIVDEINGWAKIEKKVDPKIISVKELMALVMNDSRVMGSVWNKFYSKRVLDGISFNTDLSYCEDTHFNMRVLDLHPESHCKIIDSITYNYVQNSESVTHNVSTLFDNDNNLEYINACYKILEDCHLEKNIITEVQYAIAGFAITYLHECNVEGEKKEKLVMELRKNRREFFKVIKCYFTKYNIKRVIWMFEIEWCYLIKCLQKQVFKWKEE